MYLGGYPSEQGAARAHDIMALKCRGTDSITNYDKDDYAGLANELETRSKASHRQLIADLACHAPQQWIGIDAKVLQY